jgi:cytosine deaminase
MCALAAADGRRVAMLVDDAGDAGLHTTEMLAEAMLEHGLVGRGVAQHARAVGLYPRPRLERLARLSRRAGLGFVSDPHTGPVHLPVRELTSLGVPVALGQDDIEDAYYPFGRHNLAEIAFLAAHALEAVDTGGIDLVYDAVTTTAARVLGVGGHRLEPGGAADLVVHRQPTVRTVLTHHEAPAYVVASGLVVAASTTSTSFELPAGNRADDPARSP